MIRFVIFDLGGVLVKREPERLMRQLIADSGLARGRVEHVVGEPHLIDAFERGRLDAAAVLEYVNRELGLRWDLPRFLAAWNGILDEDSEATRLLPSLRRRYQLGVISNTNAPHDDHIRRWPAFGLIHHWIASCAVGMRKPEPGIYQCALDRAGVVPHEAIYVDDVGEFVEAACCLGLQGIHFDGTRSLEQALTQAGIEW